MKKKYCLSLITGLLILSSCQPGIIKVLCLGDSITQGKVDNDTISQLSYRFWLWEKLDSAGYKVDMVGSNNIWFKENRLKKVQTPVSHYTRHAFDRDHESFYGIKTGETSKGGFTHDSVKYASLRDRMQKYDAPDYAFIHIGTNDSKHDSLETINYLKQILEVLNERNPKMHIFLAKLNTPWVRFINHSIEPIVAEFHQKYPRLKVIPVDMATGWVNCTESPGTMTYDWTHPNTLGQKVMAEKWFKAFKSMNDHEKPKFDPEIKISSITDSTATLSWTPATDNKYLAGYNIFLNHKPENWRRSECGKKEKQSISLVQGNSYSLTDLKKGTDYTISISAVDFANNMTLSKEVKFKTH